MSQILHIVDAFTDQPFQGNPAAVCILDAPGDELWMKFVAREMNLSETAFLYPISGGWNLRWLTPTTEVDLCGHATLASAFVLWECAQLDRNLPARFSTRSGWLTCELRDGWIVMDFPALTCDSCDVPKDLTTAMDCELLSVATNGMDYLVEVANENALRKLAPDMGLLSLLPVRGIIATCRSELAGIDFVSRFFAPAAGVNEDPVTGSAHCALGPYWSAKLGRTSLVGYQASERGGTVKVDVQENRIRLSGKAVMSSRMELYLRAKGK